MTHCGAKVIFLAGITQFSRLKNKQKLSKIRQQW